MYIPYNIIEPKEREANKEDKAMDNKLWYAVMKGDGYDTDWGYGSADKDEAIRLAKELQDDYPNALIAVIDDGYDPICIEEIREF